ncbi:MAG: DUF4198 domain-containing protein [Phycisphaerae bacterium]
MKTLCSGAMLFATLTHPAIAHEFWIEPDNHHPAPGALFRVGLRFGERFRGDVMPRVDELIEQYALIGPDGPQRLAGRSGGSVSFARPKTDGWHTLVYRSHRTFNEMEPKRFEAYLREEGLEAILPRRARLGEADKPGREVFSRCAKSLVLVGSDDGKAYDRTIGLPLEITLGTNPARLGRAENLRAHVLINGRPLEGARVVAVSRRDPGTLYESTTDQAGQVRFSLPYGGCWMLTTIHMTRAPKGIGADWESLWASLTFDARVRSSARPLRGE